MLKHHNYIAFFIGLSFLIFLQIFSTPQPVFRIFVPLFLGYLALITLYNRWYLKRLRKYNFWLLLKTPLLFVSGWGIFFLIPSLGLRGLFLLVSVAVVTFFELTISSYAENVVINQTLITAFGLFFVLAALSQIFPAYKFPAILASFAAAGLLARTFYELVPKPDNIKNVSAAVLALFISELFWALTFLPFHFSVLALLLFNLFYFLSIATYYYFFNTLTLKKFQFHLILIFIASFLVLAATPWRA